MERYTIENLIQGPREVKFPMGGYNDKGEDATMTVWIRPLRDPEKMVAATKARTASRTMRKLLKNKKSEQYQTLVVETLEDSDDDNLRVIWVNGRLLDRAARIREASLEDREVVPEPEGVGVTQKQLDEYENEVDDAEERREDEVMKSILRAREELTEEAKKIPSSELRKAAIEPMVESICQEANQTEFISQVMLRCTFTDKKCTKRAFADIEQIYSLKPQHRKKLANEHIALMLDQESVKN